MNIYVLNTLGCGIDTTAIIGRELALKGVIGLSDRQSGERISDCVYLKDFCRKNKLMFIPVSSYSLSDDNDQKTILNLEIDILIVAGWQRLLPEWLIRHCRIASVGIHGSPFGITGGRGRSPQNWALLLGEKEFYVSIFKIDTGIDSGEIYDTKKYILSPWDTIKTAYYKACWLAANMIIENIKNKKIIKGLTQKQKGKSFYLPQRIPRDGEIDWNRDTIEIYNFIRALTKPYPGAFSHIGNNVVKFWAAKPFEVASKNIYKNGEIVKIFNKNDILVKTGNGFLLIEEYDIEKDDPKFYLKEEDVFDSFSFAEQMKHIIQRHKKRYNGLRIAKEILVVK